MQDVLGLLVATLQGDEHSLLVLTDKLKEEGFEEEGAKLQRIVSSYEQMLSLLTDIHTACQQPITHHVHQELLLCSIFDMMHERFSSSQGLGDSP